MRAGVWLWLDFFLCFFSSHQLLLPLFLLEADVICWTVIDSNLSSSLLQQFFLFFFFSCTVLLANYFFVLASSVLRDYVVDLSVSICLLCDSTVQQGQYEWSSALMNFSEWYLVTPAQCQCIHFWHTPSQKKGIFSISFQFQSLPRNRYHRWSSLGAWWFYNLVTKLLGDQSKRIIWRTIKNILRN